MITFKKKRNRMYARVFLFLLLAFFPNLTKCQAAYIAPVQKGTSRIFSRIRPQMMQETRLRARNFFSAAAEKGNKTVVPEVKKKRRFRSFLRRQAGAFLGGFTINFAYQRGIDWEKYADSLERSAGRVLKK